MPRNLDLTALRSFVTVAETGGVTRAAGFLNLTQSAVSMQLKRLEEALDLQLLDRSSRAMALTTAGEQLLGYAKRMLELNDEVWGRLTSEEYTGEVKLGVPHDIVYPLIPEVLKRFNATFPLVKVQLIDGYTTRLKAQFASGECDIILTTEDEIDPSGETLARVPLQWTGAPDTLIWKERPLQVGFCPNCRFRGPSLRALEEAGIDWDMALETTSDMALDAGISADLAITARLAGTEGPHLRPIAHGDALPPLKDQAIGLYRVKEPTSPALSALADLIKQAYDRRDDAPMIQRVA